MAARKGIMQSFTTLEDRNDRLRESIALSYWRMETSASYLSCA